MCLYPSCMAQKGIKAWNSYVHDGHPDSVLAWGAKVTMRQLQVSCSQPGPGVQQALSDGVATCKEEMLHGLSDVLSTLIDESHAGLVYVSHQSARYLSHHEQPPDNNKGLNWSWGEWHCQGKSHMYVLQCMHGWPDPKIITMQSNRKIGCYPMHACAAWVTTQFYAS